MDEDMWHHPATIENAGKLESFGNKLIPVGEGDLASGLYGEGRMAEPEEIIKFLMENFFLPKELTGKKAIVSAGPTYEPIDPVRFIGNHSSGKMGIAIAKELYKRGAEVRLILGPSQLAVPENGIHQINVTTADEMYNACIKEFGNADIAIMSAAVADYTPVKSATEKIKKKESTLTLELTKTKDILKTLGEKKQKGQVLVGFALETNEEKKNALQKLKDKNADMIVLNSLHDKKAGFNHDTNKISIFGKSGEELNFEIKSKQDVAKDILDTLIRFHYA
jgi:phosphopantothenoylcysteine decarboxylase/phosphopantothenate--cysteine ligase